MTNLELQNNIIRQILNTEDSSLLTYLHQLLSKNKDKSVYSYTEFEKNIIEESLQEYKSGKVVNNDQVVSKIEKWLEE